MINHKITNYKLEYLSIQLIERIGVKFVINIYTNS